jgi:phosphatidate phosphatase APP1
MAALFKYKHARVKVYHGYGHTHDLVVYGHVFKSKPIIRRKYTNNVLINILHLVRLFFVEPLPCAKVQLQWRDKIFYSQAEDDGFFKFEWSSENVSAGWHKVVVHYIDEGGNTAATGEGKVFVPHSTQYAFISDIDDTVLVSHSATIGKRLRVLFTKNPRTRKVFNNVVKFYELLATAHTTAAVPNPFFYVSSSEWNLYSYLNEFFKYNGFPKGIFLLNQIKRWHELVKTGKTKHDGKLVRVMRILKVYPKQQFVLLGDNSQRDPTIYAAIVNKYPQKIYAIYIRNIRPEKETETRELLQDLEKLGVHTCLFNDNAAAIEHAKKTGLIGATVQAN